MGEGIDETGFLLLGAFFPFFALFFAPLAFFRGPVGRLE